jgi:hypothetical protein
VQQRSSDGPLSRLDGVYPCHALSSFGYCCFMSDVLRSILWIAVGVLEDLKLLQHKILIILRLLPTRHDSSQNGAGTDITHSTYSGGPTSARSGPSSKLSWDLDHGQHGKLFGTGGFLFSPLKTERRSRAPYQVPKASPSIFLSFDAVPQARSPQL